ncbi:SGNH/GDSL hydrolase family protein (plasmid) [Limimaricola variabilis]
MSDAPSLVIIGGSNSLLQNGWVDQLKKLHPQPERVVNLSIGAATTAMGLYRLLSSTNLPPNPVILWEYALNEANYSAHRQPVQVMLYHMRWLFEICARRGYPVLPVLLYNKAEAIGEEEHPYRERLAALLKRYQLKPVDARRFWRLRFDHLTPDRLYKDNPHYAVNTGFPRALAKLALARAAVAVPPRDTKPGPGLAGRDLRILTPNGDDAEAFSNRILSCDVFPLTRPQQIPMRGRLLACFLISSQNEPAIVFRSESARKGPFSAQISARETGPARQLKHLLLWNPQNPPLEVGEQLTITPQETLLRGPVVQHTMAWNGPCRAEAAEAVPRGGLIGVLAEMER